MRFLFQFILSIVFLTLGCRSTPPPPNNSTPVEKNYSPPHYSWDGKGYKPVEIPVVFHIVGADSASIAKHIFDQLDELNKQFNQQENEIPSGYEQVAANARVTFDCAGITFTQSNKKWSFKHSGIIYTLDAIKSSSKGGIDPWNPSQYLNVWICSFEKAFGEKDDPAGFAYLPRDIQYFREVAKELDGIVIHEDVFGKNKYQENRKTLVHEVGHWFDLMHPWGHKYPGKLKTYTDDGFVDTSTQSGYSQETLNDTVCNLREQNHMDYLSTPCQNIFTTQQVQAIRAQLAPGGYRHSFAPKVGFEGFPLLQSFRLKYSGVNSIAIAITDQGAYQFDWKMTARLTYLHELLEYDLRIIPIPRTKRRNSNIYDGFLIYTEELGPELITSRWSANRSDFGHILSNLVAGNHLTYQNSKMNYDFYQITSQDELFNPRYTRVDTTGSSQISGELGIDYSCISRIDYLLTGFNNIDLYIRPINSTLQFVNQGPYYLGVELWTKEFGREILISNRLGIQDRLKIYDSITHQ
ncbi:MAG: M43 family zinc metalloprotease [Bacteroidota bacterium]